MKGMEGGRLMRRGAEDSAIKLDEQFAGVPEKADGMQTYVNEFVENHNRVVSLKKQKFIEKINNNISAAELYAKQNDFLIPKAVKELGRDYETAFILKLAQELSKPEYNQ